MKILTPLTLLLLLVGLDILLVDMHTRFFGHELFGGLFDLDQEGNIPTWYSSFKFSIAAWTALACYYVEQRKQIGKFMPWLWVMLALLLFAMSLDETAQIHETLAEWIMQGQYGEGLRSGFSVGTDSDSMLWGILFAPFGLLIAAACFSFYYSRFTFKPSLLLGFVAIVLLLASALWLETQEAVMLSIQGVITEQLWSNYKLYTIIEEMAELLASSLFVYLHYYYLYYLLETKPPKHA